MDNNDKNSMLTDISGVDPEFRRRIEAMSPDELKHKQLNLLIKLAHICDVLNPPDMFWSSIPGSRNRYEFTIEREKPPSMSPEQIQNYRWEYYQLLGKLSALLGKLSALVEKWEVESRAAECTDDLAEIIAEY